MPTAATGGEIDELGGLETMRRNWQENFAQTDALGPEILPPATRALVREYARRVPRPRGGRASPRA